MSGVVLDYVTTVSLTDSLNRHSSLTNVQPPGNWPIQKLVKNKTKITGALKVASVLVCSGFYYRISWTMWHTYNRNLSLTVSEAEMSKIRAPAETGCDERPLLLADCGLLSVSLPGGRNEGMLQSSLLQDN